MRDWLKWLLFEVGAGYYARKLASGPEADLRHEFAGFLACPSGALVLDVGCGPGHLARLLASDGCRVVAVDRGRRLLRIARRLAAEQAATVQFIRAAAQQLPFASATFAAAFATTVIYFVDEPARTLAEMVRVTRPGGVVATLDPHSSMSATAMREFARARRLDSRDTRKLVAWARAAELNRRFSEPDLRGLLSGAGVEEIRMERRLGGLVWFARGVVAEAHHA